MASGTAWSESPLYRGEVLCTDSTVTGAETGHQDTDKTLLKGIGKYSPSHINPKQSYKQVNLITKQK